MSVTLQDLLKWSGGDRVVFKERPVDPSLTLLRLAELGQAKAGEVAFFFSPKAKAQLMTCRASVVVTGRDFVEPLRASKLPLLETAEWVVVKDPYLAMAKISQGFAAKNFQLGLTFHVDDRDEISDPEIAKSSVVHPEAILEKGVKIADHCVVEKGARIGTGTRLYPGCYVGPNVEIGKHCVLYPKVTLYEHTRVGNHVRVHAGVVIGADGFGYAPEMRDGKPVEHHKIIHFGGVVIGNHVEIGALTTIDRGTFTNTVVEEGAKIDNHCHLGHNTKVGRGAILCGFAALAGSSEMKEFSTLGGNSGLSNQAVVGPYAKIGGYSGVSGSVPAGEEWFGVPARPAKEYFKFSAFLNGLFKDYLKKRSA